MERYFAVTKSSASRVSSDKKTNRFQPYARDKATSSTSRFKSSQTNPNEHEIDTAQSNEFKKLSTDELNKLLLSTLSDESNPITHSDIYQRTEHIVSAASGHQRGDDRMPRMNKAWFDHRSKKLAEQRLAHTKSASNEPQVLRNVRVYINGYLSNTTDIEMKRIVVRAGGTILLTASGATHILTSQQLSGSKTHKLLTSKLRHHVHVVRPEWVMDSIAAGKKLKEIDYAVIKSTTTQTITDMFRKQ